MADVRGFLSDILTGAQEGLLTAADISRQRYFPEQWQQEKERELKEKLEAERLAAEAERQRVENEAAMERLRLQEESRMAQIREQEKIQSLFRLIESERMTDPARLLGIYEELKPTFPKLYEAQVEEKEVRVPTRPETTFEAEQGYKPPEEVIKYKVARPLLGPKLPDKLQGHIAAIDASNLPPEGKRVAKLQAAKAYSDQQQRGYEDVMTGYVQGPDGYYHATWKEKGMDPTPLSPYIETVINANGVWQINHSIKGPDAVKLIMVPEGAGAEGQIKRTPMDARMKDTTMTIRGTYQRDVDEDELFDFQKNPYIDLIPVDFVGKSYEELKEKYGTDEKIERAMLNAATNEIKMIFRLKDIEADVQPLDPEEFSLGIKYRTLGWWMPKVKVQIVSLRDMHTEETGRPSVQPTVTSGRAAPKTWKRVAGTQKVPAPTKEKKVWNVESTEEFDKVPAGEEFDYHKVRYTKTQDGRAIPKSQTTPAQELAEKIKNTPKSGVFKVEGVQYVKTGEVGTPDIEKYDEKKHGKVVGGKAKKETKK